MAEFDYDEDRFPAGRPLGSPETDRQPKVDEKTFPSEIQLQGSDGSLVAIPRETIAYSEIITNLIIQVGPGSKIHPIPVPDSDETVLKRLRRWLIHHAELYHDLDPERWPAGRDEVPELDKRTPHERVPNWDKHFLRNNHLEYNQLLDVANFLEIPILYRYCIRVWAATIEDMDPDDLRNNLLFKERLEVGNTPDIHIDENAEFTFSSTEPDDDTEDLADVTLSSGLGGIIEANMDDYDVFGDDDVPEDDSAPKDDVFEEDSDIDMDDY
ncbi:hypothetical protein M426DRAFT_260148 [Hypoxylon sp. CI-4A]|nr:hypothetical protein M426DRAFT_260148 [Hypoxylon sp. CI-4A]